MKLEITMLCASTKRTILCRTSGSEGMTDLCSVSCFLVKYIASTEESILIRRLFFFLICARAQSSSDFVWDS